MAERTQVVKRRPDRPVAEDPGELERMVRSVPEAAAGTEDLLDEIDSILEENAEEFVAAFVQNGGE